MHPLHRVAWGFLVVFIDIRLGWFDVLPDVVGWALIIAALVRLSPEHVGYRVALAGAAASLVVAVLTGFVLEGARTPSGATGVWDVIDSMVSTLFLFGTCTALRAAADRIGDSSTAWGANVVRWLDVTLAVLGLVAAVAAGFPAEPVQAAGGALALIVLGVTLAVVVVVWFLVLLFRSGREGYGVPAAPATP